MIAGALVLVLLVLREVWRTDHGPDPRGRILSRMLWPATVGFAALLVLRLVDLVVGRA